MKMMIKMLSLAVLLFAFTSCVTTTPVALPEKYNLDNDLKALTRASLLKVSNWDQADNQSIIITANGSEYYLLVLGEPLASDISNLPIGFSNASTNITPGHHKIYVRDSSGMKHYLIAKIYKLEGRTQAQEIKERLGK